MGMEELFLYFGNKKLVIEADRKYLIGRDTRCDVVLEDEHVSRNHALLEYSNGRILLVDQGSLNGTWYEGKRIDEVVLSSNSTFRIADVNLSVRTSLENVDRKSLESGDTMLFEKQLAAIMEKADDPDLTHDVDVLRQLYNKKKEKLSELAFYDTLTGIYNRRYFDLKIREEVSRALRYKRALSVLMIDIDHFKKVNDKYGHQKGDEVLSAVAGLLKGSLRGTDIVCRYGGEEIVVILPETTAKNACKIGEGCRERIAARTTEAVVGGVTVSVGVAEMRGVDTPEQLIAAADRALYEAKDNGRNRVVAFKK